VRENGSAALGFIVRMSACSCEETSIIRGEMIDETGKN
jgi:hypothetical protein